MSERTIRAGTIIVCPSEKCGAKVGTFVRDLNSGDPLMANLVKFEPDQFATIGTPMRCAKCGTPYYGPAHDPLTARGVGASRLGAFHTSEGWKP